ncbi:hypothetical protein [Magnetospirillum sp. UT-4]|uniref:hypothetical protein n=1 Tax=Magnetospirillum sp. UT-4 TaxID=2681467 RepID=UPI0013808253|nr:hypothetical protein [Magnetospirillum sp. UT-4]CAA7626955.1 conserved membrane hypothetical protein [Magnetospirillum sp. UT-4]
MRAAGSSLALAAVVAGAIVLALTRWETAGWVTGAALLLYLLLEGGKVGRTGRLTLTLAALASAAALALRPHPIDLAVHAAAQAGALVGLFVALGMLRQAAESSALIQACGDVMVRQPPGRRYLALTLGGHLVSVVLNFGMLPLLGTMVLRGNTPEAAGGDLRVVAVRTRRMLSALLRGFAVMTAWSPLSVAFVVTQSAVPGIAWWHLLPLQAVLAVALLMLGWWQDRRQFPTPPRPEISLSDWRPLGRLALLVAAVVAAALGMAELLGVRVVVGAMLAVPLAALAWLALQMSSPVAAAGALSRRLAVALPAFRDETAILGGAMYLGTILADFVPAGAIAGTVAGLGLPAPLVVVLLAWSVMALAQIGVNQIVTVTLFGGAIAELAPLGLPPLAVASGLMGAWALSACSTPAGAAVLTVARMAGVPLTEVIRTWNGRYVLAGAALLGLWLVALCTVLDKT